MATERVLERIASLAARGELQGRDTIGRRVGREANRKKAGKHFRITITDNSMTWERREQKIAEEVRLDSIMPSVPASLPKGLRPMVRLRPASPFPGLNGPSGPSRPNLRSGRFLSMPKTM